MFSHRSHKTEYQMRIDIYNINAISYKNKKPWIFELYELFHAAGRTMRWNGYGIEMYILYMEYRMQTIIILSSLIYSYLFVCPVYRHFPSEIRFPFTNIQCYNIVEIFEYNFEKMKLIK